MSRKKFPYFFLTTLCALSLEANPLEPTVTAGHATCTASSQKLEVNAHDKTIISWKDFSIGQNETTRFNLPGKDAVILNRVGSNIPSKIEGLLSSNGIVYLINPNGILITSTGTIDTAGFLASTLNITDQDFLNGGDLLFKGSGSVTHLGAIKCHGGDVVLMASQVNNEGTIEGGTITLGAGEEIVMSLSGDEKFMVRNRGSLESLKTELKADGNVYAYAIQNEGNIQATATAERAGRIYLVAERGHVTSSGILTAPGGEVRVLGHTTSLTGEAKIDVSGETAGTVLVGGDYQGKNPDILNADYNFADPQVTIKADSLGQGNGGKVIFWSNKATHFYGSISAQGGPLGGDGGLAEVSGDYLDYQGLTNLLAPLGKTGTLLLDPVDVTITTNADTGTFNACPTGTYNYLVGTTNINNTNLQNHLALCSVTINTSGGSGGTGGITVSAPVTVGANLLTLNAAGIFQTTALGTLATSGAGSIAITGVNTAGSTAVNIAGALNLASTGGFSATATTGNIAITGSIANTISAPFILSAPGALGSITLSGLSTGFTSTSFNTGAMVNWSAAANITLLSPMTFSATTGPLTVNVTSAGGTLAINNSLNYSSNGACQFISAGAVTVGSPLDFNPGGVNPGGDVTFKSTGSSVVFNLSTTTTFHPGAGSCNVITPTGAGFITTGPFVFHAGGGKTATFNSAANLSINGAFNYDLGGSTDLCTMQSVGNLTISAPITFNTSSLAMTADGAITINSGITFNSGAGNLSIISNLVSPPTMTAGLIINAPLSFNSQNPYGLNLQSTASSLGSTSTITVGAGGGPVNIYSFYLIEFFSGPFTYNGSSTVSLTSVNSFLNRGIGGSNFIFGSATNHAAGDLTLSGIALIGNVTYNGSGNILISSTELVPSNVAVGLGLTNIGPTARNLTMNTGSGIVIDGALNYLGMGDISMTTSGGVSDIVFSAPVTVGSATNHAAGDMTMSGGANISIEAPFIYYGHGLVSMIQPLAISFGGINIDAQVTIEPTATSLTVDANGYLSITAPVIHSGLDFVSLASDTSNVQITPTGSVQVTTPVPLSITASDASAGEVIVQNTVFNTSLSAGGTISVTTPTLLVGPTTAPCQIGSINGNMFFDVGTVTLVGGTAPGAYAQIGYSSATTIAPVNSNITFTGCNIMEMWPGIPDDTYVLIGHGSPTYTNGSLSGNISITSPTASGFLAIGDYFGDTYFYGNNCFTQIGHTRSSAGAITASGDISVNLPGNISLISGSNQNTYALIGHGGALGSNGDSYSGNVQVTSGGYINIGTRVTPDIFNSFAAIGHTAYISGGAATVTSSKVEVMAAGNITMNSELNNECVIGSYIKASGGGTATINVTNINVTAGGALTMSSGTAPGPSVNGTLIGALAYTGTVPFVAAGTASSTVNVNVGGLQMQTSFGGTNTDTFTLIQNGFNGSVLPTNVTIGGGETFLLGGNNFCTITSTGALAFNASGPVTLLADPITGSLGTSSIVGNGTTTVSGGTISLTGSINGGQAFITTTTGDLTVQASEALYLSSNARILQPTNGNLTVNALNGDFIMDNLAFIQNSGSGSTIMLVGGTASLLAGQGNVSITHSTGPFTLNVGDNLNLLTNNGGSAFITSDGPVTITAENISLSGLGTGQQSLIQNTAGDMLIIAMNDITLQDNALITNTGPGAVTLVVDEQAPVAPQVGNGRFILYPNATVSTASGLLHIFSARPNSILAGNLAFGQLNGNFVTELFPCPFTRPVPSSENQYETYFLAYTAEFGLAALANPSYTIFYKVPYLIPTPPTPPLNLHHQLNQLIWASSELFYFLRQFDQYDSFESDYVFCYETCKKEKQCAHSLQTYPMIHQNWTLYPIEFKKGSGCPNEKPE